MQARSCTAAALALVAALLLPSCESTDPFAEEGNEIFVSAIPATVSIDPAAGQTQATTSIVAHVLEANGTPVSGVHVYFTTTSGRLASNGRSVEANGKGIAVDTLTLRDTDPEPVTVTVRSGTVTADAEVGLDIVGVDDRPTVNLTASPATQQAVDSAVTFSANATDDESDTIGCYEWTLTSSVLGTTPAAIASQRP